MAGRVHGTLAIFAWFLSLAHCVWVNEQHCPHGSTLSKLDSFQGAAKQLVDLMEPGNIDANLKYLTSKPHMAGTSADFDQAEHIRQLWASQGLDQVTLSAYEVVLSFPKQLNHSKVTILDEENRIKFTSALRETPEEGAFYDESIPPAYISFSAESTIETDELVFANYGSHDDLKYLEQVANISLKGKLLLVRYGKFFRGDKVLNAQRIGAAGVILYSDPNDYSSAKIGNYPSSWWLPGEGIQRGTAMWHDGDPSTPMYPAFPGAHRVQEKDWKDIPTIPVHPIGFNDAHKLLVQMAGPEVPTPWRGGLNVTYRLGPKLRSPRWKIRLEVHNDKRLAVTYNVVGFIRGASEPDRYIVYGNHRDAWVFGSVDPSSATATLLEVVRAYSALLAKGWRPRRSILFCSWGASEQGYMGVTEWIEEHLSVLGARAVAHLNVDIAVVHNYNLLAVGSPLLHRLMTEAARHVQSPVNATSSLYSLWKERRRFTGDDMVGYGLSSVSDHAPFYQRLGIPCTYMLWMPDPDEWPNVDYPLYHSSYETYEAMKKFLDPDFTHHLALGRMWGWIGLALADSQLLPFSVRDEASALAHFAQQLKDKYGNYLMKHSISLDYLEEAIVIFGSAAEEFEQRLRQLDYSNILELRMINDQLIGLEKAFVFSDGLPRRPHLKNMIYGTSIFDQYSGSMLPGIEEALLHLTVLNDEQTTTPNQWDEVRHQLSIVIGIVRGAAKLLADVNTFGSDTA